MLKVRKKSAMGLPTPYDARILKIQELRPNPDITAF